MFDFSYHIQTPLQKNIYSQVNCLCDINTRHWWTCYFIPFAGSSPNIGRCNQVLCVIDVFITGLHYITLPNESMLLNLLMDLLSKPEILCPWDIGEDTNHDPKWMLMLKHRQHVAYTLPKLFWKFISKKQKSCNSSHVWLFYTNGQ